jgi:hypothetical protein
MKTTYKLMLFIFLLAGLYSCEKKKTNKRRKVMQQGYRVVDGNFSKCTQIPLLKEARPTIDISKALKSGDTTKTEFCRQLSFDII